MKRIKIVAVTILFIVTCLNVQAGSNDNTVPGKMIFSDQPFTGPGTGKTSFISKDHIYGRIEITGSSIKDAFKVKDGKIPFLCFAVTILDKNDEELHADVHNYFMLKGNDLNGTAINFDIMPEPGKATTLFSMTNDFSAGYGFTPLNNLIVNYPLDEGKYKIRVKVFTESEDGWGRLQDQEKWPAIEDEFTLEFRDEDIQQVKNDLKNVKVNIQESAFRYDKMPDFFNNGATLNDPIATNAKVLAIIKRDLSDRTILKMTIQKTSTLWSIAKDDFNFPTYRYLYPHAYIAYKMNGKCYIGEVTLRQTYAGGGKWGPLQVAFTSASSQPDRGIDCDKVK